MLAVVFATEDAGDRDALLIEGSKALMALLTVGLAGTLLKQLADAHQARRRRDDQQAEFCLDKYRRVVEATNRLRRIPLLVPADASPDTLRGRVHDVLDVAAELRLVKHQIYASRGASGPFARPEALTERLEPMYAYADALARELQSVLGDTHQA